MAQPAGSVSRLHQPLDNCDSLARVRHVREVGTNPLGSGSNRAIGEQTFDGQANRLGAALLRLKGEARAS